MTSIEYKDLRISPEEFLTIVSRVYEKVDLGPNMYERGHPEDVYVNLEVVFKSVGQGIVEYIEQVKMAVETSNRKEK
jgi:hypothetical protein